MASAGSPPSAPDPNTVIQAQENANHYNNSNPFGSATWSKDSSGRDSMTQTASPQMQALINQSMGYAETPRQQIQIPEGMSQLTSAILGRVGARYGLGTGDANNPTIPGQANMPHGGGGALNTNMAKANQAPQTPTTGAQMPSLGGLQTGGMGMPPQTQGAQGGPNIAGLMSQLGNATPGAGMGLGSGASGLMGSFGLPQMPQMGIQTPNTGMGNSLTDQSH